MKTLGFINEDEVSELIELVKSSEKWTKRLKEMIGYGVITPGYENLKVTIHPTEFSYIGTGMDDKWHAPLKITGERIQVDAWGKNYVLIDNGNQPSGIKYL